MAQFLIRIINHFASEVITKRLANSRAFQQFALRTHKQVEQMKTMAEKPEEMEKFVRETIRQGKGAQEKAKGDASSAAASFERFKAALKEEISRDLGSAPKPTDGTARSSTTSRRGGRRTIRKSA